MPPGRSPGSERDAGYRGRPVIVNRDHGQRMSGKLTLRPSEVQSFYDRFGRMQDTQSFFEDRAIEELIKYARFTEA